MWELDQKESWALWTAACQDSLSITKSQSLLKLMSIELVMLSNHFILYHPLSSHLQSLPASGSLPISQFFASGGQSIGVSASASVLPMNVQVWFPLGWTGWINQFKAYVTFKTRLQPHSDPLSSLPSLKPYLWSQGISSVPQMYVEQFFPYYSPLPI